jgi:predicted membrane metal-binding protein
MNTFSQWLHQHDILIIISVILLGSALFLSWQQKWTKRNRIIWGTGVLLGAASIFALRTPSVSIVGTPTNINVANAYAPSDLTPPSATAVANPVSESIAEIEALIQDGDKPTLVEIYSDFGIS